MVKTVLGLLDADKWWWFRIFHQEQVCKYFQRSIRHLASIEGIVEGTIVELKKDAFVLRHSCSDAVHARNFCRDTVKDCFETFFMFAFHILNDVSDVFAMHIEMSLSPGRRYGACRVRVEIGEMPAFQEVAETLDARMLFQCAKSCNSQLAQISELHILLSAIFFAAGCFHRFFASPYLSNAVMQA